MHHTADEVLAATAMFNAMRGAMSTPTLIPTSLTSTANASIYGAIAASSSLIA